MNLRMPLFAAGLVVALSAPAFAFQCPSDIAKINEAMASASLSEEQMAQVKEMVAQGQQLHEAGKHQEAVDILAQAKQIVGID